MYESFVEPIQQAASAVASGTLEFLNGSQEKLSDGPIDGRVTLPRDLFAQPNVQTEWWYYTGHCRTENGREFGFELVFFKRRTDRDNIAGIPASLLGNPMYFAHFAISDVTRQQFRYDHLRSFGRAFDLPVKMSQTACDIQLGEWTLKEIAGKHILHAVLNDGTAFDAVLEPAKPLVLNGDKGSGIAVKVGGSSKHFSYTRMSVSGQLVEDGTLEPFTGNAWMDREYGIWAAGGWDWFSMQLDDNTELMLYQFKDASGEMKGESTGTYVAADGTCTYLRRSDFEIQPTSTWTSPHTGAVYPASWSIRVPKLDLDLELRSLIPDQELNTRGTTMVVYWEGACSIAGTKNGSRVKGRAYTELVGYDMSHTNVGLTDFLFSKTLGHIASALHWF